LVMSNVVGVGQISLMDLNDAIISGTEPTKPANGSLWIDESKNPPMLKKYNGDIWVDLGELDPNLSVVIEEINETLGNMANDNLINFQERQVVKDKLTEIIGYVIEDTATSLPTTTTLDNSGKGGFWSVRKSARNAGISTSNATYVNVETRYNNLKLYLESLTPIDAWDTRNANADVVIPVTKSTFRDVWLQYYLAVDALATATAEKLKQNVDEIEIGGRNFASNGDFSIPLEMSMWASAYTGQTLETVDISSEAPPFQFALHVKNTTNANGGIFYGDMFEGNVANTLIGKDLTVQFWLKYQNIVQGSSSEKIGKFGELVVEGETSSGTKVYSYYSVLAVAGTDMNWKKHAKTFRISLPSNAVRITKISLKHGLEGATGEFWTTGIKVEIGNKMTDWTDNPLDMQGRVFKVEQKILPDRIVETVTSSKKYQEDLQEIEQKTARLLTISASSHVMTFDASNVASPSNQVIEIIANVQNISGTPTFTAIPYNSSGSALSPITLGGTGNKRILTASQWTSNIERVVITATLLTFSDTITIVKVKDGERGATGSAGKDAIVGFLTNESITLSADVNGNVSSFSSATGSFEVYQGTVRRTGTSVSYSVVNTVNCTVSITTEGKYSVTAMSSDTATATLRASYGGVTIDKVLSLSKSRRGAIGQNAIVAVLSNESATVPADTNGNVISFETAVTTMYIFNGVLDDSANWTVTAGTPSGLSGGLSGKTYTVTGMSAETGYVDLTASRNGYASITKRFTVTKSRQGNIGNAGQNATAYWLINSVPAIQKSATGVYTPSKITVIGKSKTGTASPVNYAGRFIISESTDGTTFTTKYTSGSNESTIEYTPSSGIKAVRVQMYLAGGTSVLLDEQIIPIVSDGAKGDKGDKGDAGRSITSIVEEYYYSTSPTSQTGGSWSTNYPAYQAGKYLWTRAKTTFSDGTTSYTSAICVTGTKGADGVTTYTWVKYADDDKGTGMSDSPNGKRYLGLAYNKTTPTKSTNPADYSWSPLYDNVQVGGRNLIINSTTRRVVPSGTGTIINHEDDVVVEEWNTSSAKRAYGVGGSSIAFAIFGANRKDTNTTKSGQKYVHSIYIKNNSNNVLNVSDNIGKFEQVPSGVAKRVIIHGVGDGKQYLQFVFSTTKAGESFDFTYWQPQIEIGNIATDWTPAPEDVQDSIDVVEEDLREQINVVSEQTSEIQRQVDSINLTVSEVNTTVAENLSEIEALKSEVNQTVTSLNISFEEVSGTVSEHSTDLETIKSNFNFSSEGIEIGKSNSPLNIVISNDQMDFRDSGKVIAYINGQKMYIDSLEVLNSIILGNHKIEKYNDNITLVKWIGG